MTSYRWKSPFSLLPTKDGELALLEDTPDLGSTVLQLPHHGSRTSSTPEFLSRVQPLVAVISVGADNRFGHPAPAVLERVPTRLLYRTDLNSDITVSTDIRKLWVDVQRAAP